MHSLVGQSLRLISKDRTIQTCRIITGRRIPSATRAFRAYRSLNSQETDPSNGTQAAWNPVLEPADGTEIDGTVQRPEEVTEGTEAAVENTSEPQILPSASNEQAPGGKDKTHYGSAIRRAGRNLKRQRDLFKPEVPTWFLEENVWLHRGSTEGGIGGGSHEPFPRRTLPYRELRVRPSKAATAEAVGARSVEAEDAYEIDEDNFREISAMVAAGLAPASTVYSDGYTSSKPHLILQCPKEGGAFFLDAVVSHIAAKHKADIISIDAQDIAEIAAKHGEDLPDAPSDSVRSLGYDTYPHKSRRVQHDSEEDGEATEEPFDEAEEEQDVPARNRHPVFASLPKLASVPVVTIFGTSKIADMIKSAKLVHAPPLPEGGAPLLLGDPVDVQPEPSAKSRTYAMLESFLDAASKKRRAARSGDNPKAVWSPEIVETPTHQDGTLEQLSPSSNQQPSPDNLIVHVRDYGEINTTHTGNVVLSILHNIVRKRRILGQRILIIGTTSSEDLIPSWTKTGFLNIQADNGNTPYRTIITPCRSRDAEEIFIADEKLKTKRINLRHLQDMLRRLSPHPSKVAGVTALPDLGLDSAQIFASELDGSVWPIDRVHRTATVALGIMQDGAGEVLQPQHIERALDLLEKSDNAKFDWLSEENERVKPASASTDPSGEGIKREQDERLRKLRKTCNAHEKKLLCGVIDSANIHTTFADVHVPPTTIEALKTLTSLSLIRPDAFAYGVLATDKIPGLLLYGPPGTGKTLLAKAVARESGATMLEVSGSDVYDMYVGEGEKNVRAIFTLAKKLSPCVVFIDEADAIFGSRSTSINRTSHRELVNQFLREWDGMNELSAFIMVATNRPFDLDDAVLRRLPRRLLVDLPAEKDREAILAIHLKDENLDPHVSLSSLAAKTPLYSGSDLKNLCVATALACVREENEAAAAHTGETPYSYPEKRTLTSRHFEKGLQEISASISEDMSSLAAIRKFDEKYGDRMGRKKKTSSWGFSTMTEKEREKFAEGDARVRAEAR